MNTLLNIFMLPKNKKGDAVDEKMWSYKEITQETEARIISLLREAKQAPENKHVAHTWAYGAYLGWSYLTMGYQDAFDAARLQALALGSSLKR